MKRFCAVMFIMMLFLLCFLCGCSAQLIKEYSSVTPHEEEYEVDQYSDALTAENYLGLKNAILSFVETGTDFGVVRIYTYDGNIVSDIANAVYEISSNDPLGSYAIEYMTYDYTHIISYYELYLYITYRISVDEIDSIIHCSNSAEVENVLEEALLNRTTYMAIRIPNFQEFDPADVLHRLFLSHPELGICEPLCAYRFYPDSGIQRILEISVEFPYDPLEMQSRKATLEETALELIKRIDMYKSDKLRMQALYRWYINNVSYIGEGSRLFGSAFNALVNQYGSSLGMALSVQLLCDHINIPCLIVEGTYEKDPWYWNMVYFDSYWHHFDIAQAIEQEHIKFTAFSDDEMETYDWDENLYPACMPPDDDDSYTDSAVS